jgi:hypothetical protein
LGYATRFAHAETALEYALEPLRGSVLGVRCCHDGLLGEDLVAGCAGWPGMTARCGGPLPCAYFDHNGIAAWPPERWR